MSAPISEALSGRDGERVELILRGVTVLDPEAGIDGQHEIGRAHV